MCAGNKEMGKQCSSLRSDAADMNKMEEKPTKVLLVSLLDKRVSPLIRKRLGEDYLAMLGSGRLGSSPFQPKLGFSDLSLPAIAFRAYGNGKGPLAIVRH